LPRGGRTSGTRYGNGQFYGKGSGEGNRITAENAREVKAMDTPERARTKEERTAALVDHLERLAFNAETDAVKVSAANAALDRLEGKPIARTVTAHVLDPNSLSDADLAAIAAGSGGAATASKGNPA
jgi:hypothetical protein